MIILSVDPGVAGAFAWTLSGFESARVQSLAKLDLVQLFLRLQAVSHLIPADEVRIAFMEENTGFIAGSPRTGASMYRFGVATGRVEGILASLKFELRRVRPSVWQKAIGAPSKRAGEAHSAFKGRLASYTREICPSLNARITRDNADALLILRFGLNVLKSSPVSPIIPFEQPNTIITDHDNTE